MARITITLTDAEKQALFNLAEREFREPQQQASLMVRKELEAQGLLPRKVTGAVQPVKVRAGKRSAKNNLIPASQMPVE